MGTTKIEWAEKSWNTITGCTKVSEGCKNCYAERMAKRLAGRYGYPKDAPFRVTFHPDRLDQPLRWKKPSTIFVCSMGDLFHESVEPRDIDAIFDVMFEAKQHTFLVLTKRPQNIQEKLYGITEEWPCRELGGGDYLPNVHIGVTVENQDAMWRVGELLKIPAAGRWVSVEPMLGPVDLYPAFCGFQPPSWGCGPDISGVVLGGESGPGARPMHPDWARDVRDQCADSGVPFMFKQYGAWRPTEPGDKVGYVFGDPHGEDDGERFCPMSRLGAKRAGRLLDGREHNETAWGMPA